MSDALNPAESGEAPEQGGGEGNGEAPEQAQVPEPAAAASAAAGNGTLFESIRVYPVPSTTSRVAGYVSCKVRTEMGYLYLNSMALVWGNNGLFLSFPSRKKENSPRGHEDYYFFERPMREKLQELAIQEYKAKGGNMVPPPLGPAEGLRAPMAAPRGYGQPREERWRQPMGVGYNQAGYGLGYGQAGYVGYGGGLRRPMGGYDSGMVAPRRPMQMGGDYGNRRPMGVNYGGQGGGYDRKPRFLPPQDEPESGQDSNTTPIKEGDE